MFSSSYGEGFNEAPSWVLNGTNSKLHDEKLNNVIGVSCTEVPSDVMIPSGAIGVLLKSSFPWIAAHAEVPVGLVRSKFIVSSI